MKYGSRVLSHPLLVDAAHTLFVPVAVKNNTKDDADAATRVAFKEPAWNNPVVRILDAEKQDLIERIHDDWTLAALTNGMVRALEKEKRDVPAWLRLFAAEEQAKKRGLEKAVFGMT